MKALCLTLGGPRQAAAEAHFTQFGLTGVKFFRGLRCEPLGLRTRHVYEVDHPGSKWNMGPAPVGCWIGHRMLWAACLLLDDDAFLVLEDDAQLAPDWAGAFAQALRDVPPDWDGLYLGSCCTGGYPRRHVRGRVYEVRYPLCTHAYAVRRKALGALIETQDAATCYGPIDITLRLHSWPRLRCYTILPRLANQHNTVIPT